MPTRSITLTGSAVTGIPVGPAARLSPLVPQPLPAAVRLGRRSGPRGRPRVRLGDYWSLDRLRAMLPESTHWRDHAAHSIAAMLGNDQWGDCVIASKLHSVGLWTGVTAGPYGEAVGTTDEAVRQYHAICGPGDQGCVIEDVLGAWLSHGLTVGGQTHRLGAWVAFDWTRADMVRAVIALLAGGCIGINLPEAWTQSAVWDVTDTPVVGGHDVCLLDYDRDGVYVASWGRVYRITWAAFNATRWLDEAYAMLSPDWVADSRLAPSGLSSQELQAALAQIGQGELPPGPPPPPPPAPPPPPPTPPPPPPTPVTGWDVDLKWQYAGATGTMSGTVRPATAKAADPNCVTFDCGSEPVASALCDCLLPVQGIAVTSAGTRVVMSRVSLSPGQWAAIIQAIADIIRVILGGGPG